MSRPETPECGYQTPAAIPPYNQVRSQLGVAIRRRYPLAEQDQLRIDLGAARIADLIVREIGKQPPLRPEHVATLHALLDSAVESRRV